ncbi:uncharacterized protein LOC129733861 isoform X2 [Wyeomyia smithii]|nr:uncharacterized protein LOC129733861 isoform X2 [Wyeomyia smithii]
MIVYRWLDFHFSLEDTKDVSIHYEIIVHSGNQLIFLILEPAEYPERSINHIYMLSEQRKIVKTQEMYFLFNRLPYYEVSRELHILRCLALDRCFVYRWNNDSLFLRVSKVDLDPRNIELVGYGFNITIVSYNKNLKFYYNEPLLKTVTGYVLIDHQNKIHDTQFYIKTRVSSIQLYKEQTTGKLYMCLLYNGQHIMIACHELNVEMRKISNLASGKKGDFNALKFCIGNVKNFLDWRKRWIDIIMYQIGRGASAHDESKLTRRFHISSVHIQKFNHMKQIDVHGILEKSPRMIITGWNSLKLKICSIHTRTNDLVLMNKMNEIQSNIKIQGSLQAKTANMDNLTIYHTTVTSLRCKRNTPLRDLKSVAIYTNNFWFHGLMLQNVLFKNMLNRVYAAVNVEQIISFMFQLNTNSINRMNLLQIVTSVHNKWIKGHKGMIAAKTNNTVIFHMSKLTLMQPLELSADMVTAGKFCKSTKLEGDYVIENLLVSGSVNQMPLANENLSFNGEQFLLVA